MITSLKNTKLAINILFYGSIAAIWFHFIYNGGTAKPVGPLLLIISFGTLVGNIKIILDAQAELKFFTVKRETNPTFYYLIQVAGYFISFITLIGGIDEIYNLNIFPLENLLAR